MLIASIGCGFLSEQVFCQAPAGAADPPREELRKQAAERLAAISGRVEYESGRSVDLKVGEQRLLQFDDPARAFHAGGIWALNAGEVPVALVALEHYETGWTWELISLTDGRLAVELNGWRWSPVLGGAERQPMPNAPKPAGHERLRMLQMKDFARKLSAAESGGGQEYALRLLPRPLARYSDADRGITDGALFAFAYGTNPEILMVIECRKTAAEADVWHCAFAPLTTAAATVRLGDVQLWSKEQTSLPKTQQPYTYFSEVDR